MLEIKIPEIELFDEKTMEFIYVHGQTIRLEHSLVSISKWESKYCKPFLSKETRTREETLYYIKCMTLTQNVDEKVYKYLPSNIIEKVNEYINSPMTATFINETDNKKTSHEAITSELIYYWMISLQIPDKCEKWHLNRLLMLIKVCNHKNSPKKKMSTSALANRNTALNAARRKAWNTKG